MWWPASREDVLHVRWVCWAVQKLKEFFEPLPPFPGLWCTCRMAFLCHSAWKSPCDGARGTVKRIVTKACLQRLSEYQILTAHQLFLFAVSNIKGMHFCFDEMVEHKDELTLLEERMQKPELCQVHCSYIVFHSQLKLLKCGSALPVLFAGWNGSYSKMLLLALNHLLL